jgi:putative effector of murein hydrolase
MIARLDNRPRLTAALALSTTVLAVVAVALLITLLTVTNSMSVGLGGGPAAQQVSGAGSSEVIAAPEISLERHAQVVAAHTD